MTHNDPNLSNNDDPDFLHAVAEVEQAIADLKYRYRDLQNALEQQRELTARQEEIGRDNPATITPELEKIREKLQELTIELESRLLTDPEMRKILRQLYWSALKEGMWRERFWQVVRFGGVGVILGWLLKSWSS